MVQVKGTGLNGHDTAEYQPKQIRNGRRGVRIADVLDSSELLVFFFFF